jgi:hypothetical protein
VVLAVLEVRELTHRLVAAAVVVAAVVLFPQVMAEQAELGVQVGLIAHLQVLVQVLVVLQALAHRAALILLGL